MIQSIEIQNFRCFRKTKAQGFGLINVIGGGNNAGKTAMLEAMFLSGTTLENIMFTTDIIRREDRNTVKNNPSLAWESFFYRLNKNEEITLVETLQNRKEYKTVFVCNELLGEILQVANDKVEDNGNILDFVKNTGNLKRSALHNSVYINNDLVSTGTLIANSEGKVGRAKKSDFFINKTFLPAFLPNTNREIATKYSEIVLERGSSYLLNAFQAIDNTIEEVQVLVIDSPALFVKKTGQSLMPLNLFGDAMHRIARMILEIIDGKNAIVLIDEIENGIHYTNQRKVWKMLFDLAAEFNVQIFATSHSREMIEAFTDTAQEYELEDKAGYFEMSRHYKTNDIVVNKIQIDTLEYKLENNKPFRGE